MEFRSLLAAAAFGAVFMPGFAHAHPHVFVEAKVEAVQDKTGAFVALRHVWQFDPVFSTTVLFDFDADGDSKLSEAELAEVGKTIKKNIEEFEYFTSLRSGKDVVLFEAPEAMTASLTGDNQVVLTSEVKLDKPLPLGKEPFRISVSDPSFYVAFDLVNGDKDITISGPASQCEKKVTVPDFDKLMNDENLFSESLFESGNDLDFGDEFYTWIDLKCSLPS